MMQLKPFLSEPKSSLLENTLSDDGVPYSSVSRELHGSNSTSFSALLPLLLLFTCSTMSPPCPPKSSVAILAILSLLLLLLVTVVSKSVRVSNELGTGHPKSAAFAVVIVTLSSLIIALIFAVLVLVLHHDMSYAFTSGSTVADAVSGLSPYLVVSVLLSGVQPVLSGVAVGCGWQAFVAYINVGCYHFIGIPLGSILGFKFEFGARGIWSGMIGGSLMQTVILVYVTSRTDWVKDVRSCIN